MDPQRPPAPPRLPPFLPRAVRAANCELSFIYIKRFRAGGRASGQGRRGGRRACRQAASGQAGRRPSERASERSPCPWVNPATRACPPARPPGLPLSLPPGEGRIASPWPLPPCAPLSRLRPPCTQPEPPRSPGASGRWGECRRGWVSSSGLGCRWNFPLSRTPRVPPPSGGVRRLCVPGECSAAGTQSRRQVLGVCWLNFPFSWGRWGQGRLHALELYSAPIGTCPRAARLLPLARSG